MTQKKKITYNKVFNNEFGKEVLADLRVFCCATKTTEVKNTNMMIDPYQMAILEGRRQVFMQIMNTMKVDYSDYYEYDIDDTLV